MKRDYPNLCKPITLGNVNFRNRMFAAPVGATDITESCCIGPKTVPFYENRAKGGAAAVTVSELMVHPETDGSHMLHLNLTTPGSLSGFAFTADAIRRHGAVPSVELSHSGQYAGTYLVDRDKKRGLTQYGPSDGTRPDGLPVAALSKSQLHDIVDAYGNAAALAKRAGFEMIMVHAGHGWLLNQFLSPYFNHRTDEYSGDLPGRARLLMEVLEAVRGSVGKGFPIELRISGAELFEGGYGIETGVEIAQLVESKVDLIHVSAGSYQFGFSITHPSMFRPHGCNVPLAAEIKRHVKVPVAAIGGLNDPDQMEQIIASGQADVVEMARALLADPQLPNKIMANQAEDITRCLRCFVCMAERANTQTRRCTVNPQIGREPEGLEIIPARKAKRVLVAGGGCAGMKAAITAAQRGHRVILCEASDTLGGILKDEQAIDFKYEMYRLGLTLARQMEQEGVEVRLNTPVTPELAEEISPDALILALGSKPIVPGLPGIQGDNVIVVNDYYLHASEVQESVVVLGGGLAGCECAVHLARQGRQVAIVEMRDSLAPDANLRHRPILLQEIQDQKISVYTGYTGAGVTAEGLLCKDAAGADVLVPGKTVICAVGQRANRADVEPLLDCAPFVRQIGDCVRPSNVMNAIYQGYHAGLDI